MKLLLQIFGGNLVEEGKESIYIADDDENIREGIKIFLESEGYQVNAFATGDSLLEQFRLTPCDLVILDVMMPGTDGFTICAALRKISIVPIIILTARDTELDYAKGITLGSDDYFTKPFSTMSLVMRVKAIFRRISYERNHSCITSSAERLLYGNIVMDTNNKILLIQNEEVQLTPNEYNLLAYMLTNRDRALSRDELLNHVWGIQTEIQTRAADDTILRLRKKLSGSNVTIDSVWGFGFRIRMRDENV